LMIATKVYEDALIAKITEPVFDDWLDRIPLDVDPIKYTAIVKAMLDNVRKYRTPTKKQIELILDLGFANLKYAS
jgi:hypothetical protein